MNFMCLSLIRIQFLSWNLCSLKKSNLAFASNVLKSIAPLPFMGPKTWLLVSSTASNAFLRNASSKAKRSGSTLHSLKEGLPAVGKGDVCILVTPSTKSDYVAAQTIAAGGLVAAVILQNGFAKVRRWKHNFKYIDAYMYIIFRKH